MADCEKITAPKEGSKVEFVNGKPKEIDDPTVVLMEGDGIGPDVVRAAVSVLEAAVAKAYEGKKKLVWFKVLAGESAIPVYKDVLPEDTLKAIEEYKIALKGPLTTPIGGGFRSLNVTLRQKFDLYACVRPVKYYDGVPSPVKNPEKVNIVVFRENVEDVYAGIEWKSGSIEANEIIEHINSKYGKNIRENSGIGIKPISAFGTKRLVRAAIKYALENNRKSVTLMHKGNIMKFTEGAFKDWGYEIAREEFANKTVTEQEVSEKFGGNTPEGKLLIKDRIADSMFQQILLRPEEYDVLATLNLNGDYISDALAAQVGGIGIAPGANIGNNAAIFEATHGSAPKYAGQDKANPSSVLLSGVMMLEFLGWKQAAKTIDDAYKKTIAQKIVTYDFARLMQGAKEVKASEFAQAIIANL
ncbi:isocitrate dehydrogenase (NADP(+)) [Candidatus Micrarchaeota archaeon]|nr:isocitrate dehydrogenase (NADP(+)) [Candidatus Micrarchaeota archaeon]